MPLLTAKESGAGGNGIALAETFSNVGNVVSGATLTGGASNWSKELIPLSSTSGQTAADDEISLVSSSNNIYIATETQGIGNLADPQVVLFSRTPTGTWAQHVVKTDQPSNVFDRKRPVVAILDSTIYVIGINNGQTESSYWSAPLGNLDSWTGPTFLFNTQFEEMRNNIVPRFPTTGATGLPVLIDNLFDDNIWQIKLPHGANQAPAVSAGLDKTVDNTPPPALGGIVANPDGIGNPLTILWTQVSGPGITTFTNAALPNTTATFSATGVYVLKLTATESGADGLSNSDLVQVTVATTNLSPNLTVSQPVNLETHPAGALVTFSASSTDPEDGNISAGIVWTSSLMGSTPIGVGGFFQRTLPSGTHVITARISDGQNVVTAQRTVTIGAVPPPPPPGSVTFAAVQSNAGLWKLYKGATVFKQFYYGNPGDYAFMGDWNCDGVDTPGLYRRSDGYVYLRNTNTQGIANKSFFFGNPGDLPMPGDFDNDGCDTVSIYRPSEGKFYIMNHLGAGDAGLGAADYAYFYGNPGDAPFMGDWNGDGIDTPGLRRNSNGFVYLRNTNTQGNANISYFYGNAGDVVFTGDWDKDGDDTLGLYRPSTGNVYLRNTNNTGVANHTINVGTGKQADGGNF